MKSLPAFLVALVAIGLAGCAMTYTRVPSSVPETPLGAGINVDSKFAVPVFRELPDRACEPIGVIKFSDSEVTWNQGDIAQAAKLAKKNGGDAMILSQGSSLAVKVLGKPALTEMNLGSFNTFGIAIKWKPEPAAAK